MSQRYLIIGNGIAGVNAGERIRALDPEAEITIITDEPHPFYSRPGLMYYMMGTLELKDLYCHRYEGDWYGRHRLRLVYDRVERIETEAHLCHMQEGGTQPYDRLLLATGAVPIRPPWEGCDLEGIFHLNTLADSQATLDYMESHPVKRAVVIGAGLTGVELAEVFRHHKLDVTMLEHSPTFFPKALSVEQSPVIEAELARHKVELHLGVSVTDFLGENGAVAGVATEDGTTYPADIAGVAVGVGANTGLAGSTGIEVRRGIVVDDHQRTSAPDIYAAGDCAEVPIDFWAGSFVEALWYTARLQGEVAGENMAGGDRTYSRESYNVAKFFGVDYAQVGAFRYPGDDYEEFTVVAPDLKNAVRVIHKDEKVVGLVSLGSRIIRPELTRILVSGNPAEAVRTELEDALLRPPKRSWLRRLFGETMPHTPVHVTRGNGR